MKNHRTALGIMNGTSVDSVDFVQISLSPKIQLKNFKSFAFPKQLREQILKATRDEIKVHDLARLHHDLGRFYAICFKKLPAAMKKNSVIGLHGQTVFHEAPQATLQIGEPSYLAEIAKTRIVCDFRPMDLAVGGQGAPIATLFHQVAFGQQKGIFAVHNLGGISNFTLIHNSQVLKSFDTGPANILLDAWIQLKTKNKKTFDAGGLLASKGVVDTNCLKKMLGHSFFKKAPPKSCGKEQFGTDFLKMFEKNHRSKDLSDQLATLTELTAASIAQAYQKWAVTMPKTIYFCGGGAQNDFLLSRVQTYLPTVSIQTSEDAGWPSQSIEGAAFALLADYKIRNKANNIPKTTGAKKAVAMGKLVFF